MCSRDKSYQCLALLVLFSLLVISSGQNFYKLTQFQDAKVSAKREKIVWCTIGEDEQHKCLNLAKANERDHIKVGYDTIQIECYQAFNKDECMIKLDEEKVTLTTLDAGQMFLGGRYHSLVAIAQEELEGGFDHYYSVAVVKKGSMPDVGTLWQLRGRKVCFPGVETFAGWILPIHTLMKEGGMDVIDCNNHVKTASKFFGPSCAVNCLSDKYNPIGDNSDKLCQLCIGKIPGGRCTDSDPYAGYEGAFKCLLEAGEIAFLKHNTVQEIMKNQLDFTGLTVDGFELFCKDGSRRPLSEYLSCNWGKVPSDVVVSSSAVSFEDRILFQRFLAKFSERYGRPFNASRNPLGVQYDQFGNPIKPILDQYGNPILNQQNDQFSNQQFDQFGNRRFKRQNFGDFGSNDQNDPNRFNDQNRYGQNDPNRFNEQNRYGQNDPNRFNDPQNRFNEDPNRFNEDPNRFNDQNRFNEDPNRFNDQNRFNENPNRFNDPQNRFNEDPNRFNEQNRFNEDPNRYNNRFEQNRYDPNRPNSDSNNPQDPFARDPYILNPDKYGVNIDPYTTDIKYNKDTDQSGINVGLEEQNNQTNSNTTFYEEFHIFDSSLYGGHSNLLFQDTTRRLVALSEARQTYTNFLGDSLQVIMGIRDCPVNRMTLCVTSDAEKNKCVKMRTALKAQLLKPEMDCHKAHSQIDCMKAIQGGQADVTVLDASDVYTAGLQYHLVPFISEVYNLEEPEYYVVAVAKESDPSTELTYLRQKNTCHGGISTAAGWVYPMAFLISNGWIRPYGCDSVRAAAEYFTKSCIPGALSTEYNTGVPYDNMCDLCHGSSYRYCKRDASEDYYGHTGAFRCLVEGGGHVAFVKHTTVTENTGGKKREWWARDNLNDDFELLCPDGTRAEIHEYTKCNLGKVKANAIVTRESHSYDEIQAYINLFLYAQTFYGRRTSDEFSFSMFLSEPPYSDLIFQDATTQLKVIEPGKRHFSEYLGSDFMRARRIVDCHAGAKHVSASILLVVLSILMVFL